MLIDKVVFLDDMGFEIIGGEKNEKPLPPSDIEEIPPEPEVKLEPPPKPKPPSSQFLKEDKNPKAKKKIQ